MNDVCANNDIGSIAENNLPEGRCRFNDENISILFKITKDNKQARILITLDIPEPESRGAIANAQDKFLESLASSNVKLLRRYESFPMLLIETGRSGLEKLLERPEVKSISPDTTIHTMEP